MGSMEGLSDIIRQLLAKGKTEKLEAVAQHIDTTVNSLNSLLENLLNWSLSQINGLHINKEEIYLKNVIEYNADIQKTAFNRKNITFEMAINDNIKVVADQNMLRTVVRNLISNAIKFTPDGGRIIISANSDNKFVHVCIKDNGIGITPEKMEMIFETCASKITPGTNGEKGTGLGLNICKYFISLNNGSISISSENGKGTEVHFSLPCLN